MHGVASLVKGDIRSFFFSPFFGATCFFGDSIAATRGEVS
jgi:hypothetical protein